MIKTIYTIGFTKKTANDFFDILGKNNIDIILDIRLNNTSQLSAFTKFPDFKVENRLAFIGVIEPKV